MNTYKLSEKTNLWLHRLVDPKTGSAEIVIATNEDGPFIRLEMSLAQLEEIRLQLQEKYSSYQEGWDRDDCMIIHGSHGACWLIPKKYDKQGNKYKNYSPRNHTSIANAIKDADEHLLNVRNRDYITSAEAKVIEDRNTGRPDLFFGE